jgi:hypothetical protein
VPASPGCAINESQNCLGGCADSFFSLFGPPLVGRQRETRPRTMPLGKKDRPSRKRAFTFPRRRSRGIDTSVRAKEPANASSWLAFSSSRSAYRQRHFAIIADFRGLPRVTSRPGNNPNSTDAPRAFGKTASDRYASSQGSIGRRRTVADYYLPLDNVQHASQ